MHFREQQKKKAFTLSYDDAVTQDIRLIDLLDKYHLKCTFNINSQLLGKADLIKTDQFRASYYKVHPEHFRDIYALHEVAAHTLTHPNLTTLDEADIIRQVEEDRLWLSEAVGYEVVGMAYPCGGVNHDARVEDIIRKHTGIRYARTIECSYTFDTPKDLLALHPTAFHLDDTDRLMELAKKFLENDSEERQIFYLWGHSYELDFDKDNWYKLEAFFDYIGGRDDVFYGTNKEVLL